MLNRVILVGRLVRQPELRYTPSGKAVTSFTLAVDRNFTNQQGERSADFINCLCWGKTAEIVAQHLDKGRLVAIDGRLQTRSYETKEGQKRQVTEVVAEFVQFLDKAKPKDDFSDIGTEVDINEEDLPF